MASVSGSSGQCEFTFTDGNGMASNSPPPIPSIHFPGYFPTRATNPPIPLGPDTELGDDFISSIDWSDLKVMSLISSIPLPPMQSVPLTGSAFHTSCQGLAPYMSSESPSRSDGTTMPASQSLTLSHSGFPSLSTSPTLPPPPLPSPTTTPASQSLTLSHSDSPSLSTSPTLPPPPLPSPTPIPEHQQSSSLHGNPNTVDDSDESACSQQANSSTWQARNPGQPIIQPRVALPHQTAAQKASCKIARAQKAAKAKLLYESIEVFLNDQRSKTEALSRQHDVTVDHVKQLIGGETHYHTSQKIQLRNALVHAKAVEVNTGHPVGSKFPMVDIQRMVQEDLKARTLTCEEEEEYITKLAEHRDIKVHGVCANNTAASHDVLVTVDRVATELENLRDRTGIYAMLTRYNSADFWDNVLQKPIADIARQYEQWACTQNQNLVERDSLSNMRKQVTRYISDGLRKITGKCDIAMNYINYDAGIVQAYNVQLVNWPEKVKFGNPSTIGTVAEIRALHDALKAGTCTWKKLTRRELDAHSTEVTNRVAVGDVVKKTRKKRSDTGVPRKRKVPADAPGTETQNGSARKKLKASVLRTRTVPKSVAFLPDNADDDTEEEEEAEE
ncbi:hypothetical protein BU15DRAFT_67898 [Melanogaster broomeanus]|nr:hypothetical protein BU15DRAFT_67898 [Melanogaster broomeanus]